MPSPKDPIKRAEWIKKFSDKNRGKKRSKETRRKMSEARLGKTYKKISEALTRKPLSEEHKKKISETKKGKHPSKESRMKMSVAQKRRFSEEDKKK
jgi:hypothetical protein